jgi:hypothetical protein
MTLPLRFRFVAAPLALWVASCLSAAEPKATPAVAVAAADPDLPQDLDAATVNSLLTSSPFTRYLNMSERLMLTGVAYIQGKPVATIQDKITKGTYLVSDTPNEQGWKLAGAVPSNQLKRTEVKILVGGEVVTIRYSDQQLVPETAKKSFSRGGYYDRGSDVITTRDGQTIVRSSFYMTDEQREKYYSMPNDQREKWRDIMRNNNTRLLAAPAEEREAFVKKSFDQFQASQGQGQGR